MNANDNKNSIHNLGSHPVPNGMKILVTGGAGFIGSALAQKLFKDGHEVVVIDNFTAYYDVNLKRDRVKTFLEGIEVVEGDIMDETFLDALFAQHDFDVVCHLAGNAGVRYSTEYPGENVDVNVRGTINVYEAMKKYGVKRMVFASSSSVYGVDTQSPFTEDAPADRPVSIYGSTKRACELNAFTYYQLAGIETTCLRFFTVYGPWSRPDMAMLKFAQLMTAGKPIDVYNNGDLRRDFTHISDIVEGFALAVEKPLGYEIINLGRGESTELLKYIELLEKVLGVTAIKNMMPMQDGDVFETFADTTKAKELLGFTAKMPIDEGVQTFGDWYKEYYLK